MASCMYFMAIVCPESIGQQIKRFKDWMRTHFGCVIALRSPAHITLIPPFWWNEEREVELKQALGSFQEKIDFTVTLDGFSHFGKRVLFVQVKPEPQLDNLKKCLEQHFDRIFKGAIKKDDRPFHPHVTIANRDMEPGHFVKAWEHFSSKLFSVEFPVGEISLLKLTDGKWKVI